jgi:glycosyltransferase involved in cell wall biosynthesis
MSERVAYLVNRYPAVSHTFIRREIEGLEAAGLEVLRYSVRGAEPGELVDPQDLRERERTAVLLDAGAPALALAALGAALGRPARFLRALALALRIGSRSPRGRLRHLAYLVEACLLRRVLAREGAAHLHAHFGTNPATVALLCRLLGGPPYSLTAHGPEEFDRPEALALPAKIRHAAFVVGISEFGRSQLRRWAEPRDWPKLHVVRCGVDSAFLAPSDPPAAPRAVCVGRLCVDKAQNLLVEAAARLAAEDRQFELVLVGDGDLRPLVEERIRSLGLEGRVQLRGWLGGEGVRAEIRAARCLVLPSLAEGLPVVLMEALALGRPVISTTVAGIPELVEPGRNGWLVPPGSVDALAAALREALEMPPGRLAELGRAGSARVAERHDARREAARLAGLLRDALGGAGR